MLVEEIIEINDCYYSVRIKEMLLRNSSSLTVCELVLTVNELLLAMLMMINMLYYLHYMFCILIIMTPGTVAFVILVLSYIRCS